MSFYRKTRRLINLLYIDCYSHIIDKEKNNWPLYQKRQLFKLLCYVKVHSSFFRGKLPDNISIDNCISVLKSLPVINKKTINELGYSYYSDEITKEWSNWSNTGGSTGEPFRFPRLTKGKAESICQRHLYKTMGSKGSLCDTIVSIDGTRVDEFKRNNHVFWNESDYSFPYGKFCLSTIYMDPSMLPYYVQFLNTVKPTIMRGYPSGFCELAHYIEDNNITLSFQVKGIYLTSEGFDKKIESLIGRIFKCSVYGQYGHTEASIFAIKYPEQNEYYVSPLYGFTEVLNDNDQQVEVGEMGRIVVTGFTQYGTPFIRYDTGDLAEYGGVNEYGEVVLSKLLGRSVDYVVNGHGEKIYLIGFIFGGHLKAFNYINKWQLEQDKQGLVRMRIVKGKGYCEEIEKEIVTLFGTKDLSVDIDYVETIQRTNRGKEKFIIQHLV